MEENCVKTFSLLFMPPEGGGMESIMARKPVLEGGKRDELIDAALKLFLERGYTDTSVRMILDEVGGEIGMFYHYFPSKQDIFIVAVKRFLSRFEKGFSEITEDDSLSNVEKLDRILDFFLERLIGFKKMQTDKVHWSMQIALQQLTLKDIVPHVSSYVKDMRDKGELGSCEKETDEELAYIILYSVIAIFYEIPQGQFTEEEMEEKKHTAKRIVGRILDTKII